MKYNPSIAFDEMSGSAKGVTAAKTRGRKYIRYPQRLQQGRCLHRPADPGDYGHRHQDRL